MENRFGVKDLVLILLLVAVIVTQWLAMAQDNRHWDELGELHTKMDEQTNFIATLRQTMLTRPRLAADERLKDEAPELPNEDTFRRLRNARENEDYAQGDWVVESFQSAPPKLNPLTAHDTYSRVVYSRVGEPLASFDIGKVELVPHLATDWKVAEDGLSMDVNLRQDVTFSDGKPMDADDVVYTWKLNQDPDIVDGQAISYLRHITKVEKTGPYSVRFQFDKVFYENELRALEVLILPKHFYEQYSDQQIRENPALLLGTGPYKLPDPTKYAPGDQIELVRNDYYWGVPGPYDRMIWRIIEKESAELVAFQNGEIDIYIPTPEQHMSMLKDKSLVDNTQQYIYEHVRSGYSYIGWNQKRKGEPTVFADKRVRQAMTMLIDRERIAEQIYLGFASVATGPFHHMGPQYNEQVEAWPYDPNRAIELLKSLGFTRPNPDGPMLKPNGEPFTFGLVYPAGSDLYQKIMLFVKDNLKLAGIDVQLKPQKWTLLLQSLTEKDFDAITLGWGAGNVEGDIEQMFHSRNIAEGDNRNAYSNPELDALIEKAHVTLDEKKRMEIWKQTHAILHEDQPYTFMHRGKVRLWMDDRFRNIERIPVFGVNYVSTWPVPIEWYVPEELQKHGEKRQPPARAGKSPF